jgi:hypothetical protein
MIKRLDIKAFLQDPSTRQQLHQLAVAGILSRLTYVPHTISMSNINPYVNLAQRKYAGPHISIEVFAEISRVPEAGGAWVRAWVWVDDPDPEPGPTKVDSFFAPAAAGDD